MNQKIGIIGGADGPTAVYISGIIGIDWINVFGLIIIAIIMIPNIIYAVKTKDASKQCAENAPNNNKVPRGIGLLEQIGRYASMFLMVFNIGLLEFGFCSVLSALVYIIANALLLVLYVILWIPYARKKTLTRALPLAVIPTVIFLLSGILLRHYLLILSAVLFGIGHIYVTCKTH